ncbi:MAG: glycerate kinase, partial [Planctomycetes bacterium]|nr:glycerate kinase [Planctomycetota bacterium]
PVRGSGIGGRNQAFVLACASLVAGEPVCVLSAGTDGIDGNSPAAGGWVDGNTAARAVSLGLDLGAYTARSDSHTLLDALGQTIVTGPTGNNVRDLRILLAE